MTIAASRVLSAKMGRKRLTITNVTLDNAYPTGGEAVTANNLGLNTIEQAIINGNTGHVLQWDQANKKIKAYYGDYSEAADGALVEVANNADLSTVVATVWAIGN